MKKIVVLLFVIFSCVLFSHSQNDFKSESKSEYCDVVFSEIMANPASGNPEFIELYNRSDKPLQLKNWKFYYGDKPYLLPEAILSPEEYIVLCKTSVVTAFQNGIKVLGVPSFPVLANTGKLLYIENNNSELVAWMEYADGMYGSAEKKSGGWSLECIDLSNISNAASNWTASVSDVGHTAGKKNSVNRGNPDTEAPGIKSVTTTGDQEIVLAFTKPMNRRQLEQLSNFRIEDDYYRIRGLKASYPQADQVQITLSSIPPEGTMIEVQLELQDASGNYLPENTSFFIGSGYEAAPLDAIINEIMFNAPEGSEEYIEVYNRSDKDLDLRYLSLTTRKSDGSLNKGYPLTVSPLLLHPSQYVVVSKNADAVCSRFFCRPESLMVGMSQAPVLNNTSADLVLLNNRNDEEVDRFSYNEKMHHPAVKDKKGVALERVDPEKDTGDPENWTSATAASGFGTPGYQNSQYAVSPQTGREEVVSVLYPEVSLGRDSYEIQYRFDVPGNRCRVLLFDSMGRMVGRIANNELLGMSGSLRFDNQNISGQRLYPGLYVIYMEVYSDAGSLKKYKLPVVMK